MPTLDGRAELFGYSCSDLAGDAGSRKSQSSDKIFADGVAVGSFSGRQSVIAASSSTAELFTAAAAVAEHRLHIKTVLEFFGFETHAKIKLDSTAANGLANREGVGSVRSLWKHVCCGLSKQFEGD